MYVHFLELFMATMAIRISDEDRKLFTALADREHMPLSVLVRRTLHAEAVRVGLVLGPVADTQQATEPEPQKAYGLNEDGIVNHRLRVAKARTLANDGVTKVQVAKAMGLTLDQIETARVETAKQGMSGAMPWHSNEKVFALNRLQANPSFEVPDDML